MEDDKMNEAIDFGSTTANDLDKIAAVVTTSQASADEAAAEIPDDNSFDISNAVATGSFVDVTNAKVITKEESEAYAHATEKLQREVHRDEIIRNIVAQKEAEYFEAHHFALFGQQKRKLKRQVAHAFDTGKIKFNRPSSLNK